MNGTIPSFVLPKDGDIFINLIIERCEDLIDAGIWEGLDTIRINTWMKNFTTPTERYFAACVLDALIYRPNKQTLVLMEQLFQRVLPDLTRLDPPKEGPADAWHERLGPDSRHDPGIRVVPIIRRKDPPTKSGPSIARFYKRNLEIRETCVIWPDAVKKEMTNGIKVFLFVDDFLGTGRQFSQFFESCPLYGELDNVYAVYAPLVAHESGISCLRQRFPGLRVCAVEILDNRYDLFASESMWFQDQDQTNTPQSAHLFYRELVKSKQLPIGPQHVTGFGNLAIAYSFEHATPDNCLPILWLKTKTWTPLFER